MEIYFGNKAYLLNENILFETDEKKNLILDQYGNPIKYDNQNNSDPNNKNNSEEKLLEKVTSFKDAIEKIAGDPEKLKEFNNVLKNNSSSEENNGKSINDPNLNPKVIKNLNLDIQILLPNAFD